MKDYDYANNYVYDWIYSYTERKINNRRIRAMTYNKLKYKDL